MQRVQDDEELLWMFLYAILQNLCNICFCGTKEEEKATIIKMSKSSEPTAKKPRVSIESENSKDRVIIAGKKKFNLNSEDLISKSEYFRILFQSDFKDKTQKIIELKEMSAESFEQFLLVIDRPEDFEATKVKLIDLIATLDYFNYTDPLKTILRDSTNFSKIAKKELLEMARTFAIPDITEVVEDWYLARFKDSHLALKYQQLHYAVEYGMERLETRLLDFFTLNSFYLNDYMEKILNDDSAIGKKVYEKIKISVFEEYIKKDTLVLHDFTEKMNENQFEDVKDEIENIFLSSLERSKRKDLFMGIRLIYLKDSQLQKMEKLKVIVEDWYLAHFKDSHLALKFQQLHYAVEYGMQRLETFIADYFFRTFRDSDVQLRMIEQAQIYNLTDFLVFAIDHFIADYPKTHDLDTIFAAINYDLKPLKDFLKDYLRQNYANLDEDVKKQMKPAWGDVREFIKEAIQGEL